MFKSSRDEHAIYVECSCHTHVLRVGQEVEFPHFGCFYLRFMGQANEPMTWRDVWHEVWQLLRHRRPFWDYFELGETDAVELAEWLQKRVADKQAALDVQDYTFEAAAQEVPE